MNIFRVFGKMVHGIRNEPIYFEKILVYLAASSCEGQMHLFSNVSITKRIIFKYIVYTISLAK